MKTGILTHYQVHNHGAVLQLFGLAGVLKKLGCAPSVLTYTKNYDFINKNLKNKYNISLKSLPFVILYLIQHGTAKTFFNIRKYMLLNKFKKKAFSFCALEQGGQDAVIVGSDEVFSLEAGFNKMMYGIDVDCKHLLSYAPSFGQTSLADIKEKGCFEQIKNGLGGFKSISVRDKASADVINGLLGFTPQIVCDPVFLYGFDKERTAPCRIKPKKPYLLIYAYDKNMNAAHEIFAIRKYAKKRGLLVVSAGYYHHWADKNINTDPLTLTALFNGAECVVTDTFHGAVLSILNNKSFAAFPRPINVNKLTYLLDSFDVASSKMESWEDLPVILSRSQNWTEVNKKVSAVRAQGLEYLKKGLGING